MLLDSKKVFKRNYPTYDFELLAMVFTLKIWIHYSYWIHVDIYSSHKILKYVFTEKELNLRIMRWLKFLKDYDMSLHYHPGKYNMVGDDIRRLAMKILSLMDEKK